MDNLHNKKRAPHNLRKAAIGPRTILITMFNTSLSC
jgi:hypothetical protein